MRSPKSIEIDIMHCHPMLLAKKMMRWEVQLVHTIGESNKAA